MLVNIRRDEAIEWYPIPDTLAPQMKLALTVTAISALAAFGAVCSAAASPFMIDTP